MIQSIQQGLLADGVAVPLTKLCAWFGVPRRTVYYKPTKAAPKVDPRFADPIKAMIEKEPSFGYRTVAWLLGFNKNTVQRIFQIKGWQVRMRSIGLDGRLTVATANRALSNADGSEVQLFGNAIVTREPLPAKPGALAQPRMEFRGEFLHAFTNTERVRSDQPVTLTRGNDRFTADGMDYDNLDQVLQLRGRVRGMILPGKK